jgi:Family of unknown function (DUF5683)
MRKAIFIFFFSSLLFALRVNAQHPDSMQIKQPADSVLEKKDSVYTGKYNDQAARDSIEKRMKRNYHRATLYSAILPGAGQVYNKKYWKVPIIYAALGISAYAFFYNKSWYNKCQYALTVTVNGSPVDSVNAVDPQLKPFVAADDQNGLITYRDSFRKNQDYSVLFFLLFYGLNIVDATVDAHLKDFNVNSDLSFKIKPMFIPGPNPVGGITLAFDIHKPRTRGLMMN